MVFSSAKTHYYPSRLKALGESRIVWKVFGFPRPFQGHIIPSFKYIWPSSALIWKVSVVPANLCLCNIGNLYCPPCSQLLQYLFLFSVFLFFLFFLQLYHSSSSKKPFHLKMTDWELIFWIDFFDQQHHFWDSALVEKVVTKVTPRTIAVQFSGAYFHIEWWILSIMADLNYTSLCKSVRTIWRDFSVPREILKKFLFTILYTLSSQHMCDNFEMP